jgi:hypothetical protein
MSEIQNIEGLKNAVDALHLAETKCIATPKHVRLEISSASTVDGLKVKINASCGHLEAKLPWTEREGLSIPTDACFVTVCGAAVANVESGTDTAKWVKENGVWKADLSLSDEAINVYLTCGQSICVGRASLDLDASNDTSTRIDWLSGCELGTAHVKNALNNLCKFECQQNSPSDVHLSVKSGKKPFACSGFSEELVVLNRKMEFVRECGCDVMKRFNPVEKEHGKEWFGLFVPFEHVIIGRMHATFSTYMPNAVLKLQDAVSVLQKQVSVVNNLRSTLQDVAALAPNQDISNFLQLGNLRQKVLGFLDEGTPTQLMERELYSEKQKKNIVDRRAYFIALSCIDASLRVCAARISGRVASTRDVDMCAYQLRQVMANNQDNDIKLSAPACERSLNFILEARELANKQLISNQTEYSLIKDFRIGAFLEAARNGHANDISPSFNWIYNTASGEQYMNACETNEAAAEARSVLAMMADTDLRHRIISPLLHQAILGACLKKTNIDSNMVIDAFANNVRPLARLALQETPCADPFAFLKTSDLHTGYDEDGKTKLLIKLIFK